MSLPDFLQARPAEPVLVHPARGEVLPIVCDSPHSGTAYPEDFGTVVPMSLLRRGEDTHVAALWDRWPEFGATLLEATFPRTYVDPNRNESDLDPAQIEGEWPVPLSPSIKTQQGLGLIWQRISKAGVATPLYERKRTVADEDLGPLVASDMTRCIQCTRCVRFTADIAGTYELGGMQRGENLQIGTYDGKPLTTELSGNVIDVCPVGALTNKVFQFRARPWELTARESLGYHDAMGSNLFLHVQIGRAHV